MVASSASVWNQIQAPHAIDATLDSTQVSFRRLDVLRVNRVLAIHDRGRGGGPYVGGRWADGFSPSDRAMLEKFHEAGGYLAFEQARIEEAVLARLVDRGEKLPKELIDVVVEFLELPRWRPAPAPKKE